MSWREYIRFCCQGWRLWLYFLQIWSPHLSWHHHDPGWSHLSLGFAGPRRFWRGNNSSVPLWIPVDLLHLDEYLFDDLWAVSNRSQKLMSRYRIYKCTDWWNLGALCCFDEPASRPQYCVSSCNFWSGCNACWNFNVLDSRDTLLSNAPNHRRSWSGRRRLWDTLLWEEDWAAQAQEGEWRKSSISLNEANE